MLSKHYSVPRAQRLLNACSTDDSAAQGILVRIHDEGTKYVVSVSNSVQIARSGYEFADRAQDLCAALIEHSSDEIIHSSITEMKSITRDAHAAAKITADMFRANLQEFIEVW
jgi:hypothetical protein